MDGRGLKLMEKFDENEKLKKTKVHIFEAKNDSFLFPLSPPFYRIDDDWNEE